MTSCTVGNYQLVEKLGEGGMGAVYRGVDLMVEREVAIKMLRPEIARQPEVVERFRAEAVALAKLNHPNIATLYSFFREGDEYYMVMEFVAGRTLESLLRGAPPVAPERAVAVCSQVLDAIEHAHSYGILHRDIKPANIMLTASGQAKVTDFGIARVLGTARMTREGCLYGTLEYLAPERVRGQESDIRSDLYSMGVVLYEMVTAHLPFERDSEYELMRAHLEETPPSFASLGLPSIPAQVEWAVAKALAKDPAQRFESAAQFRSALASAASTAPSWTAAEPAAHVEEVKAAEPAISMRAETSAAENSAPPRARRWKPYAVAAAVLLLALVVAFSWSHKPAPAEVNVPEAAPSQVHPESTALPSETIGNPEPTAQPPVTEKATDAQQPRRPAPENHQPGSAAAGEAAKAKSPVATDEAKRKAALKALEKGSAATPASTKEKDKRSSALKALND